MSGFFDIPSNGILVFSDFLLASFWVLLLLSHSEWFFLRTILTFMLFSIPAKDVSLHQRSSVASLDFSLVLFTN